MYYYDVLVASISYHAREALTYESAENLPVGSIVDVPVRKQVVRAVVISIRTSPPAPRRGSFQKGKPVPAFKTKPITKSFGVVLPRHMIELIQLLLRYYPASAGQITQLFAPNYSVPQKPKDELAALSGDLPQSKLPPLTKEQQAAMDQIASKPAGVFSSTAKPAAARPAS